MAINQIAAKAGATRRRVVGAWSLLIGARVTAAMALMFAIAFGTTLIVSPPIRLPPIGLLTPVQVGLPIGVDLAKERAAVQQAIEAAKREELPVRAKAFLADKPQTVLAINWTGLIVSLLLLTLAIRAEANLHRRGIKPA